MSTRLRPGFFALVLALPWVAADGRTVALVFSDASRLPGLWRGALEPFAAAPTPTINPQADG